MLFVVILFLTQNIYSQNSENITQIGLWEKDSCLAVSVADTLAYLAAGTKGMYIIDVSNPSVPEKIGSIKSSKGGKAIGVKVSGVFAYVLYDKTPISYMQIVDITDPTFPIDVATIEIEKNIYDLAVDSSHVYIAGLERMHIVDISNKETPIEVGSFNTEYSASSVEVKDSYVYLTDLGWSYGKVRIIDVANPFAPEEKSYIVPRNDGGPYTATISESSLFVSWLIDLIFRSLYSFCSFGSSVNTICIFCFFIILFK
ncbi:MAG: hypothetical protein L3J56_09850 [Bacteroidales bacterium]|nr:hypothetical protein [Bacteroidales bacterium]